MTAIEPERTRSAFGSLCAELAAHETRLAADGSWREDVALEMWVDVTSEVVVIRLEGVLDGSTGANLTDVVRGCQAEGACDFVLDTGALRMDRTGWAVINRLREQIHAAGGRLHWDSTALA